jgi:Heterokaryon incompatibility protein (HET)
MCTNERLPWPTRVIDVASKESPTGIRLIDSKDIDSANCPTYMTLSHCWGPPTSEKPLRTMEANVKDHFQSIDYQKLSTTFKDAIKVTRDLGSRYLWIDSLCIIQDNAHDWQVEAAAMADIYRGSRLTIVAVDSPDSHGGCFLDIGSNTAGFEITSYFIGETTGQVKEVKSNILSRKRRSEPYFEMSPATERGWVLQETAIPPRRLFCARDQFYWECRTCLLSEDGALEESTGVPGLLITPSQPSSGDSEEDALAAWRSHAQDYSRRKFTHYEDRLAALAGLTTFFAQRIGDTAMLGLWKRTVAQDLGWERSFDKSIGWLHPQYDEGKEQDEIKSTAVVRANQVPSWSWLSIVAPILSARMAWTGSTKKAADLELLEWHIEWTGPPYSSSIVGTILRVCSANIPVKLVKRHHSATPRTTWRLQSPMLGWRKKSLLGFRRLLDVDFQPDSPEDISDADMPEVRCLFLYTACGNPIANRMEVFLVIGPSRQHVGAYCRHGVGHVETKADQRPIFQDMERSAVRLI